MSRTTTASTRLSQNATTGSIQSNSISAVSVKRGAPDDAYVGSISEYSERAKRVKASNESDATPPQGATFHPSYDHPDGSVIIHMPVGNQLFRLYRDYLARKSPFFKNKFEEELQPLSSATVFMSHCPIVKIPEGNAQCFAVLLGALEDFRVLSNTPFHVIASILISSTELDFPEMREWATKALELMWPDSYKSVLPAHKPYAVESIVLARRYNIPKVLKRAKYEVVRDDNFSNLLFTGDKMRLFGDDPTTPLLDADDMQNFMTVREEMSKCWVNAFRQDPFVEKCRCHKNAIHTWYKLQCTTFVYSCLYDPVLGFSLIGNTATWSKAFAFRDGYFMDSAGQILDEDKCRIEVLRTRSIDWKMTGICQERPCSALLSGSRENFGLSSKSGFSRVFHQQPRHECLT